jgi:SAM-dependent methyltransferase
MSASDDVTEHRDWLLSLVPAPTTGLWVDLGCGKGTDVLRLAASHAQPGLRILGIDESQKSIEAARHSAQNDPRVEFRQHSLRAVLPLEDASVEVVFSHNLIECLADVPAFSRELARILRPGGYVVMGHWDWDSQLFDGDDNPAIVVWCMHFVTGNRIGWSMRMVGRADDFGPYSIRRSCLRAPSTPELLRIRASHPDVLATPGLRI